MRDIARSDRSIDENADHLPEEIVKPVLEMHGYLNDLMDITVVCLTEGKEVPADEVRKTWKSTKDAHAKAIAALSTLQSDTMGGKASRLEVVNIVNRVDRWIQHCSLERHVASRTEQRKHHPRMPGFVNNSGTILKAKKGGVDAGESCLLPNTRKSSSLSLPHPRPTIRHGLDNS